MTDTLSNKEIDQLIDCGKAIQEDLMCDANGTGLPCRTDRLSAVESMKEYLEIHGYKIEEAKKSKSLPDWESA